MDRISQILFEDVAMLKQYQDKAGELITLYGIKDITIVAIPDFRDMGEGFTFVFHGNFYEDDRVIYHRMSNTTSRHDNGHSRFDVTFEFYFTYDVSEVLFQYCDYVHKTEFMPDVWHPIDDFEALCKTFLTNSMKVTKKKILKFYAKL